MVIEDTVSATVLEDTVKVEATPVYATPAVAEAPVATTVAYAAKAAEPTVAPEAVEAMVIEETTTAIALSDVLDALEVASSEITETDSSNYTSLPINNNIAYDNSNSYHEFDKYVFESSIDYSVLNDAT